MGILHLPESGAHRGVALTASNLRPLVRVLASAVGTIVASSVIIFAGLSLSPGDPALALAGDHPTEAQVEAIRHEMGLDQPVTVRYVDWVKGVANGELGISVQYRESVNALLGGRLGTTCLLIIYSFLIVMVFGIGLAIAATLFRRLNGLATVLVAIGTALPSFIAALVMIQIFSIELGWLPVLGTTNGSFPSDVWHLTLPAVSLAIAWCAYVAQVSRASLREADHADHVETSRVRGIPTSTIFRRHVLRNAAIPIVTISALTVAGLVANTVVIESVFDINGIGSLLVSSVLAKDTNAVMAISMLFVCTFVLATALIDVAEIALDPRLRRKLSR